MDRCVLVTGGSSGIGAATVDLLMAEGYTAIALSRGGAAAGARFGLRCDVSDPHQVAQLPERLRELGIQSLCGAFLAAGGGGFRALDAVNRQAMDAVYATDFAGTLLCVQALEPMLRDHASVVLCSSAVAGLARAQVSYYGALKAAVESLTLSLAAELGPRLRVNCVAPGAIATPLYRKLALDIDKVAREVRATVPLQRMGTPLEVAQVVAFLLSDRSSYVSGAVIPVHGGGLANRPWEGGLR